MDTYKQQSSFNVVLLNDDDHSYDYVIEMLHDIFGYSPLQAYLMAVEVDTAGRVVVSTTSLERAQEACDMIHAYGADPRLARSVGPMAAIVEPVT